jgi:hypothetical protein
MCDRIIFYKYFSQIGENSPHKKNLKKIKSLHRPTSSGSYPGLVLRFTLLSQKKTSASSMFLSRLGFVLYTLLYKKDSCKVHSFYPGLVL